MPTTKRNGTTIRFSTALSGMVVLAGLFLGMETACAQGRSKKTPPDSGVIYYSTIAGNTEMMQSDGSQQTVVVPGGGVIQPSRTLHNGVRWFLTFKPWPAEGAYYPDGRQRFELFAISDAGVELRLSDSGGFLQPIDRFLTPGITHMRVDEPSPRWGQSPTFSGDDTMVTWLARRLYATGDPNDPWAVDLDSFGIYAVEFPDISALPLPQVPVLKITCTGSLSGDYKERPDITSYDWDPSDTQMTYGMRSEGIWVADIPPFGMSPSSAYQLTSDGWGPLWSPVGDLIMFQAQDGVMYTVETMELDGSNRTLVVEGQYRKKPGQTLGYTWSPNGTHLTYYRICNTGTWYRPKGYIGLYRALIDGSDETELLEDASPIGWRDG